MARLPTVVPHLRPGMPGASGGVSYLKGMEVVMARLNKELEGIKVRSESGMIKAAAHIRTQTETVNPLTPMDLGNLVASWFVATAKSNPRVKGRKVFKGPNTGKIKADFENAKAQGINEIASMTTKDKKFVMMGYGADYAGWVHEFIPGIANFKRMGSKEKWLQDHLYKNTKKIAEIIAEDAKVKG